MTTIYLYDASSRAINQLTDNSPDYEPQINGGETLYWYGIGCKEGQEIYFYDALSRTISQITYTYPKIILTWLMAMGIWLWTDEPT